MALDPRVNFGKVTVSTGYNASATSIVLSSGEGAKLPSTQNYNLVWWNATDYSDPTDDPNAEIVRVTARTTDTLTVTRAQEGTTGSTKNTTSKTYRMVLAITKKMIDDIDNHTISTSNPHSVTSTQVGLGNVDNTSDATKNSATATLTNKTLTSPTINTPTINVNDDVFTLRDNVDTTKLVKFEATNIPTGTTQTFTFPSSGGTIARTSDIGGSGLIGARVTSTANQSIPNNTETAINFDGTDRYDTNNIHSPTTNNTRLTCNTAGTYIIVGQTSFVGNATGYRSLRINLNAATTIAVLQSNPPGSVECALVVSTIWDMAIGDYVQLAVLQTSGGALNVYGNTIYTEFMMQKIG